VQKDAKKRKMHGREPVPTVQYYKNITKILNLYYNTYIMLILDVKRGKINKDSN